jgi:hypothetical protein
VKRFLSFLSLACFGLMVCIGIAYAADPVAPAAASPAPAALAAFLRDSVFPIVGTALMGFLSVFLARLGAKYKIDALTQKNNFVEQIAFQGITLAEEKAAQLVGSKSALTGSDKMDIAIAHVITNMPKFSPAQAESIVNGLLARIPGVGATGAAALALPAPAPAAVPAVEPAAAT